MSLINEVLTQRLRHLIKARRRPDDVRADNENGKRSRNRWHYPCNRRYTGGQDTHSSTSRSLRRPTALPVGSRCIVPLLHIWLRLSEVTPTSSYMSRERCIRRMRLKQRPLMENMRHVLRMHWRNFRQIILPESESRSYYCRELNANTDAESDTQSGTSWLQYFKEGFDSISKKLETALTVSGPSPDYANTSEAMELVDIGDIIDKVNSALIEHLINNEDYTVSPSTSATPSSSLTELDMV